MATPIDPASRTALVHAIHDTDAQLVLYITGGGIQAVSDLLTLPGASRTVLDVQVPYSHTALASIVDIDDDGAASPGVAESLASAAHSRATLLAIDRTGPLIGVGCTSALMTDRARRGSDRAHIACFDGSILATSTVRFDDDPDMTRPIQDRLVADAVLAIIGKSCENRVE